MERLEKTQAEIAVSVARIEESQEQTGADVEEIKRGLFGRLDGRVGLLGRVRDNEYMLEQHDLDLVKVKGRAGNNEQQLNEWRAQLRLAKWLSTGGGVAGFISLIVTLIRLFGG